MNKSHPLTSILGLILSIGMVFGLVWGNYIFAARNIRGEGFIIQWMAIRSLIVDGKSPYSDQVTAQIQAVVKSENSFTESNPPRYTSPLYSGIVVFPFALIANRTLAHALWLSAQLIAIFLILLLALRLTGWKPRWYLFVIFTLLTLFSYHVVIPWLDGGLAIWSSLFLAISLITIYNNRDEIGGISLALSAIQPQMVIVVIVFVLIWAASQRKKALLFWFFISLVFISAIALVLVPDWVLQYIRLLYNYPQNYPPGSLEVLFKTLWPAVGKQLGWLLSGVSALVLLLEWRIARKKEYRWFLWTACLTLAINQWTGIPATPGNFTALILPLVLVNAMLTEHWPKIGKWMAIFILLILFGWEWGVYYLDITGSNPGMQLNLLIPLPLVLIIGLYWVRWWAIKPRRLLLEELRFSEVY